MLKHSRAAACGALFLTFLKIGAFTFGGGYAMIPLIQREAAEKHHWISPDELPDIVAVAESTPGPIAVNSATFVGRRVAGIPGAVCATLGVTAPSFWIILALSAVLQQFESLRLVRYAFAGVRAGVLALMCKALWTMARSCPKNLFSACLIAGAFLLPTVVPSLNVIFILLACALAGIGGSLWRSKRIKGGKA